jgi:PAS domain S-box-containing protein
MKVVSLLSQTELNADRPLDPASPASPAAGMAAMTSAETRLYDSIVTPISITARASGAILFSNRAAQKLFGLPPALIREPRFCANYYADPGARSALVRELDETGQIHNREIEFVTRDGRRFWGLLSSAPIELDGMPAVLSSIVDISQQHARETQLAQVTEQLRAQASETLLLNRELQRQQQVAIAANRAKSDFLARMSHELRSPLNAILGFSEIIGDDLFGAAGVPRYQGYARNINEAGAHLLALINDILDLSKVEAGRLELNAERVDAREVIHSCLPLVNPLAERRGVQMTTDLSSDDLAIEADHLRLRQIVLNILSNAVKFTLAGGTVMVTAAINATHLVVEVADSGIGMSPEQVEIALQPFGQVVTESPYAQVGTGLGLPIVVSLVELHGGRFDIQSIPNVGTRVTVRLPRQQSPR